MFLHKLALRMGRTISELSPVLPMDEFVDWMAYDRIMPIGDEKWDWLFAQVCAITASASGGTKKGGGRFQVEDFLMYRREKKPKTVLETMTAWLGHRVVKGKRKDI